MAPVHVANIAFDHLEQTAGQVTAFIAEEIVRHAVATTCALVRVQRNVGVAVPVVSQRKAQVNCFHSWAYLQSNLTSISYCLRLYCIPPAQRLLQCQGPRDGRVHDQSRAP